MNNHTILVTGGAGYIGSHVCYILKQQGWEPVCFDNFSTGHRWAVKYGPLVEGDLLNPEHIRQAIKAYKPLVIMHLASFIQVGESVKDPLKYYKNNISGMVNLLEAMKEENVPYIIFSSSAAVYGNPLTCPIDETHPCQPINPYGYTKLMIEQILADCGTAYGIRSVSLRYFNAAGAAPEEGLGEAHEPETHLIPLMIQAAQKIRESIPNMNNSSSSRGAVGDVVIQKNTWMATPPAGARHDEKSCKMTDIGDKPLKIFGNDYETVDGTCLRDYIHILDLADAHLKALEYLIDGGKTLSLNLGSGKGTTNLEIIQHIEKLFTVKVPFEYAERRLGDPAKLVSSYKTAQEILGWRPRRAIEKILKDAWAWHQRETYG
jgi:UDP-glucose 4-epimerase